MMTNGMTYLNDINPSDVTRIEGSGTGSYTYVFYDGKKVLSARPMSYLLNRWPHLVRIRKCVAVSRDSIEEVTNEAVILKTGEKINIPRVRRGNSKIQPQTV